MSVWGLRNNPAVDPRHPFIERFERDWEGLIREFVAKAEQRLH